MASQLMILATITCKMLTKPVTVKKAEFGKDYVLF